MKGSSILLLFYLLLQFNSIDCNPINHALSKSTGCHFSPISHHCHNPPLERPTGWLGDDLELLFTEGQINDQLKAFINDGSIYTEEQPMVIYDSVPEEYRGHEALTVASMPVEKCPEYGKSCWKVLNTKVPTIVYLNKLPHKADIIVTLFCVSPTNQITSRPFGRTGSPFSAKFISEPGYRITASSCEDSTADPEKMKRHHFLMSYLPGADIFLPPWQLHVPLHFDKLFFLTPLKWLSWKEKGSRMRKSEIYDSLAGSNRLGMYLANNCQQIDRYHWINELIHQDVVDSYGTCQNNAHYGTKKSLVTTPINRHHWPNYGWRDFIDMHIEKIMVMSDYFFYFAFENSRVDPIWLTEKYIASWISGSLPVFMGPANWEKRFLPAPHSAIFVDDFQSAEHLADYLKRLAANQTAYDEYFAWHQLPVHQLSSAFLSLWEPQRRYTYLRRLSDLAAYSESNPTLQLLQNHRIFHDGKGFVSQRENHNTVN